MTLSNFSCADWLLVCYFMKRPNLLPSFQWGVFLLLSRWCAWSDTCLWAFSPTLGLSVLGFPLAPTCVRPRFYPEDVRAARLGLPPVLWVLSPRPGASHSGHGAHRCRRGWPLSHPEPEVGTFSCALKTSLGIKEGLYFVISVFISL